MCMKHLVFFVAFFVLIAACQQQEETTRVSSSDAETVGDNNAGVRPGEIYQKDGYTYLPYSGYIIEETFSEEQYPSSTYKTSFSTVYIIEGYAKQAEKGNNKKYIVYPTVISVYNYGYEAKGAETSWGEQYKPYEVIYRGSFSQSFDGDAAGIGGLTFDDKGTAALADDTTTYAFSLASFGELHYGTKEIVERVFDEKKNTTMTTVETVTYTITPYLNIGQGFHPDLCTGVYYSDTKLSKPSDCIFVVDNSETAPYFVSYYMYDEIRPSDTEVAGVVYDWDLGPYSSSAEAMEKIDISESPLKDDDAFAKWLDGVVT